MPLTSPPFPKETAAPHATPTVQSIPANRNLTETSSTPSQILSSDNSVYPAPILSKENSVFPSESSASSSSRNPLSASSAPPSTIPIRPSEDYTSPSTSTSSLSATSAPQSSTSVPATENKEDSRNIRKEPTPPSAAVGMEAKATEVKEVEKGLEAENADEEFIRGDPRMKRALQIRLENPTLSPVAALILGGYTPVEASTHQHRNQLSRRVRIERQRIAQKNTRTDKGTDKKKSPKKTAKKRKGLVDTADRGTSKKPRRGSKAAKSSSKAVSKKAATSNTATTKKGSKKSKKKSSTKKGSMNGEADAPAAAFPSLVKETADFVSSLVKKAPVGAQADNDDGISKKKQVIGLGHLNTLNVGQLRGRPMEPYGRLEKSPMLRSAPQEIRLFSAHEDDSREKNSESVTGTGHNINNCSGSGNSDADINSNSKSYGKGTNNENNKHGSSSSNRDSSISRDMMKGLLSSLTRQFQEGSSSRQMEPSCESNGLHLLGGMAAASGGPPSGQQGVSKSTQQQNTMNDLISCLSRKIQGSENSVSHEEKKFGVGADFGFRNQNNHRDNPGEHGSMTSELTVPANFPSNRIGGPSTRIDPVTPSYSSASTGATSINETLLGPSTNAGRFELKGTGSGNISELMASGNSLPNGNGGPKSRAGPVDTSYSSASIGASSTNENLRGVSENLRGVLSSSQMSVGCGGQPQTSAVRFGLHGTGTGNTTSQSLANRSMSRDRLGGDADIGLNHRDKSMLYSSKEHKSQIADTMASSHVRNSGSRMDPVNSSYSSVSTGASSINETLMGVLSSNHVSGGCGGQPSTNATRFERQGTGPGNNSGRFPISRPTRRENSLDSALTNNISQSFLESMMTSRSNSLEHGKNGIGSEGRSTSCNVPEVEWSNSNNNCFGHVSGGNGSVLKMADIEQARGNICGPTGSVNVGGRYGRNNSYSQLSGGSSLGTTIAADNTNRGHFATGSFLSDRASSLNSYNSHGNNSFGTHSKTSGVDHLGQTPSIPPHAAGMMQPHTGAVTTQEDIISALSGVNNKYAHMLKQCAINDAATTPQNGTEGPGQSLPAMGGISNVSLYPQHMDIRSMAAMLSSARSGTPADVGHNPSSAGHHHNSNSPQDDSYNNFVPSGNGNMANARALMGLQQQISGGVMEHNQLRQNMIPEENDPRLMTDILAIVNQLVRQQHHQQNQQQQHHQHQYQQQQQQQHQQQLQQQIHQQHFQQQRQSNTFSNNNLFPMGGSSLRSGSDMDAGRSSSYIGGYGFMSNGLGRRGSSIGMGSVGSTPNGSYNIPMTASRGYSGQHNTNSPHSANSTGSFSGHHSAP
eukprot:CAMPEP_0194332264 /NCGR_PEP_ID=MMETSP0171-20130528/58564_1 /TAXON_ID=218684 /ORGANISM="Corethron pennatum, Strain L29A3" /LENGTH=1318 /DNA_ID=CAMNT_0039094039 /DNA_START=136 /DNA_END=4092 /DNA_ORIENTATION=+